MIAGYLDARFALSFRLASPVLVSCLRDGTDDHSRLDPHPGSHTVVALDNNGASLGHLAVPNTQEGLNQLHEFGSRFSPRRWAVEGAGNHFIAAFVAELLANSEAVFSIPPSLTSQYRARRGRKKSDVVDAENVARALLANAQLPPLRAVASTRVAGTDTNTPPSLRTTEGQPGALKELAAGSSVREVLQPVIEILVDQLKLLRQQIRLRVKDIMPALLDVQGVGPIVAGILLAEVGNPKRFASANHLASYCGAAPVERGSG